MQDRLMIFIDGSNLLRATAKMIQSNFRSDKPPIEALDVCATIIRVLIDRIKKDASFYDCKVLRKYWFGSYQGNEHYEAEIKKILRSRKMEPIIFKKHNGREKRVDIAIAREMLINAINKNYDLGLLVAGDEDYLDLIADLKRLGVRVIGSFYNIDLSEPLRLSFDYFHQLHVWGEHRSDLVKALNGVLPK
jgi:uncharacterized LabA/DUF88 family protein